MQISCTYQGQHHLLQILAESTSEYINPQPQKIHSFSVACHLQFREKGNTRIERDIKLDELFHHVQRLLKFSPVFSLIHTSIKILE
jgi:hypothetical protein